MCHELEFPNLSSMCFYFKYGIPSTFHQLHAASSDINPGHIDLLLKKTNPLKLYNLEQTVTDETLFRSKRETAHHYKVTALYNSIDVGEDVCFQLNKRFTRGSQAVAYHNCREGSKLTPIVFDTGCSVSITPHRKDFIGKLQKPMCPTIKGVGKEAHHRIEGFGIVEWTIYDANGFEFTIRTHAYYVPSADIRLFSPQTFIQEQPLDDDVTRAEISRSKVTLFLRAEDGRGFEFPFHPQNNIPYMLPLARKQPRSLHLAGLSLDDPEMMTLLEPQGFANVFSVLDETNQNISAAQKELQLWHWRLCHAGLDWIQGMMQERKNAFGEPHSPPILSTSIKTTRRCEKPKCCACSLSKQHRRGSSSQTVHLNPRRYEIKDHDLLPGQCISTNQYYSALPGRRHTTFGK
jgi:hypothetical protein